MSSTDSPQTIRQALLMVREQPGEEFVLVRKAADGETTVHYVAIGVNTVDDMLLAARDAHHGAQDTSW